MHNHRKKGDADKCAYTAVDMEDSIVMFILIVRDHVLGALKGIFIENMATMDPFFAEVDDLVSRLIIGALVVTGKDNYVLDSGGDYSSHRVTSSCSDGGEPQNPSTWW